MKSFSIMKITVVILCLTVCYSAQATIHHVDIANFFFSPQKTIVDPGDTVRWTLVSGIHTTTSDAGSSKIWDSGNLSSGQTFDVVFTEADGPGPFPYLCMVHPFTMLDTIYINVPAEPKIFSFYLEEGQANAGAGTLSSAGGFGLFILNADETELSIYCEHDVAAPIDGHIHLGSPGVDGPIRFGFTSPMSPISETWMLSSGDVANLLSGDLYVNIHSTEFPAGEIRGQIVQEPLVFNFDLDESQANACAGTGSAAVGSFTATLNSESTNLEITGTHTVVAATDIHIHFGLPCVNGTIRFGFSSPVSPISENWAISTADIKNLLRSELYVNIHSFVLPGGEIRSQIENAPPVGECCDSPGDGNNDGDVGISDLTYFVDFMFGGSGLGPVCFEEFDNDGDCTMGISDLTYFVDFMFGGGPSPVDCHDCGF